MPKKSFAVIGHPIAHSKSPALHQAAYVALGNDWSYEAIDVEPGGLQTFLDSDAFTFSGLSVTMPHKVDALELSHQIDLIAEQSHAVNTLYFDSATHTVSGFNTDVWGIVESVKDSGLNQVRHAAIIGAGATAASAVVAAAELGAEHISVAARNVEKAYALETVGQRCGVNVSVCSLEELGTVTPVELCISTLPGTVDLSLSSLQRTSRSTLLDVAYDPWPSIRAGEWAREGGDVVSGLRMLAHQALFQVRIFTSGSPFVILPDEDTVKTAMFEAVSLSAL